MSTRLLVFLALVCIGVAACSDHSRTLGASKCKKPAVVVDVSFSQARYPDIYAHVVSAQNYHHWPVVLVLNRTGAAARRAKLLAHKPTMPGLDRDEYPPAFARRSYKADVAYVPSSENRAQGTSMGDQLRPYCNGTKFRYVWRP